MQDSIWTSEIGKALETLQLARFVVTFQVGNHGVILPPYKGSVFRGALGHAFRQIACTCSWRSAEEMKRSSGQQEIHAADCVYSFLFEGNVATTLKVGERPRPIILVPPLEEKQRYLPGEKIALTLTLFGQAVNYLPHLISVLELAGRNGLGKGKQPVELTQVFFEDRNGDMFPIYHRKTRELDMDFDVYRGSSLVSQQLPSSDLLELFFVTPTRIKFEGEYVSRLEFHLLVRNLLRRLSYLLHFYHEQAKITLDFHQVFRHAAEQVSIHQDESGWYDWQRYSNRQKERMKLGGVIGRMVYRGEWQQYLPLLKLGEWIHVGKNTMFGLGKIKVIA